jgi:hypothetical protein
MVRDLGEALDASAPLGACEMIWRYDGLMTNDLF